MVGKKAVLMLVLLSLGMVAGTLQPAQSVKTAMIDFEGLTEGDIVSSLSHGAGISGDPIEGDVTVFGSNPNFPGNPPDEPPENTAMIFDANCEGGCSGGDDDLDFSRYNLGNGLIISEDLDSSDPDDAEGPGDFYFEIKFSNFGNAKVKLKKLTYADLDGEETGSIELYKGDQLIMDEQLKKTGNNEKDEIELPGEEVNDIDRLVVKFTGSMMIDNIEIETESNGLYTYYLPLVLLDPPDPPTFDVTIGYEDRLIKDLARIDYDYNDWAVSIDTDLQGDYVSLNTIKLEKITFTMMPKARGGKIDHEFHLRIDANTFSSDGDYELVIKGEPEPGGSLPENVGDNFEKSEKIDVLVNFLSTGCDCEAFGEEGETPVFYNVCEEKVEEKGDPCFLEIIKNTKAVRWAELSITFKTPFEFDLPGYGAHCQGLFFDPYLKVKHDGIPDEVSRTPNIDDPPDPRILCVKDPDWHWPEEGRRIDLVYPDVKINCPERGKPPTFEFLEGWDGNHNSCVFDGKECVPKVDICKLK